MDHQPENDDNHKPAGQQRDPDQNALSAPQYDVQSVLKLYYQRLFPFRALHRWLSYGNAQKNYFACRELAFTYKDDIYSRFNSFPDCEAFHKATVSNCPQKIDIGAVYNAPPKDRAGISAFKAMEKELVFDIDMDGFDNVRTCCSGAEVCLKCWPFMTIFIKIANHSLREDFGFEHLLWVFSGRRGVHCWVCDSRARQLGVEARRAIVDFLSVINVERSKVHKTQLPARLHPSLLRAYEHVLQPTFVEMVLTNQGMMDTEERRELILAYVPGETQDLLRQKWNKDQHATSPVVKWEELNKTVADGIKKSKIRFVNPIQDIVFNFLYPRLDVNVSHDVGHLLKSPFCVHPSTGRICVPIDPDNCESFDPMQVPTVGDLIKQIDDYDSLHPQSKQPELREKALKDYKKTTLKSYVEFFKKSFLQPLGESIKSQLREQLDANNAVKMEF